MRDSAEAGLRAGGLVLQLQLSVHACMHVVLSLKRVLGLLTLRGPPVLSGHAASLAGPLWSLHANAGTPPPCLPKVTRPHERSLIWRRSHHAAISGLPKSLQSSLLCTPLVCLSMCCWLALPVAGARGLSLRHRRPIFVWEVKIWMSETLPDTPRPLNFLKIDVNSTYKHLLEHP